MADSRIVGLNAITEINPALDFLPIVDVSDNQMAGSGTTKKITINQILGAGGNVVVPLGTAAAPSVSFSGDSNTGIFSTQADQFAITVGGTARGTFSGSGLSVAGNVTASGSITASLGAVTGIQLISTAPNGTQPLAITSQTVVSNLNADFLDGQHGSYYRDAGNINAGTLAVARGGTGAATFTAGQVLYGNGTSALSSSSSLFWDSTNGRLGIGTATPSYALHSVVTSGASAAFKASTAALTYALVGNTAGDLVIQTDASGNGQIYADTGKTLGLRANGSGTSHLSIASDGVCTWSNVGGVAGTAMTLNGTGLGVGVSPSYKLDVAGTINSTASTATGNNLVFRTSGITTGRAQALLANTSGDLYIGVEGSTAGQSMSGSAAYSAFIGTFTANPFYLATNGSIRQTIDSSGNVGIGTATPAATLDVRASNGVGAVFLRTTNPAAAVASAYIQAPVSTGHSQTSIYGFWYQNTGVSNPAAESLAINTNGTERLRIDSSGNLGLGVSPSAWTTLRPVEIGTLGNSVAGYIGDAGVYLLSNAYLSASGWKYALNSKLATRYSGEAGIHKWQNAPNSGADGADTALTWQDRMVLDASGNLLVGTVSSPTRLHVVDDSTNVQARFTSSNVNGTSIQLYHTATGGRNWQIGSGFAVTTGNFEIYDVTAAANRFSINSSGNVILAQPLRAANGNASAPSISFDSDTDTGVYRIASNTIGIATGGITAVRINPTGSFGYSTDIGGAVTQATSRTTGVTLSKPCGSITLFSAAGSTAWQTFTVTNSVVEATDVIKVCQQSGTDLYQIHVTNVASGSFKITFATTGGTTTEQPVFNFAVIKASAGAV